MEEKLEYLDPAEFEQWMEGWKWKTCQRCRLHETRIGVPVRGSGPLDAKVLIVGEAPGQDEELSGKPFVGRSGQKLDEVLDVLGLNRAAFRLTNVVMCRPKDPEKPQENRDPYPDEIAACLPRLLEEIYHVDPLVIIGLGNVACKALAGAHIKVSEYRKEEVPIHIPSRVKGALDYTLFVGWHPAYVLRKEDTRGNDDVSRVEDLAKSTSPFNELAYTILMATAVAEYLEALYQHSEPSDPVKEIAAAL